MTATATTIPGYNVLPADLLNHLAEGVITGRVDPAAAASALTDAALAAAELASNLAAFGEPGSAVDRLGSTTADTATALAFPAADLCDELQ
ncbi:hypothetical protein [Nocardia cyriacigeorgica]|uniref:hypothetical protein n=1 Tax=Nocardia cyriacigeorgica TaxID=135487 RepID=UPI002456F155|nr:hypothetical protein [Nocardia cyriacigeorgica]